MDDDPTIGRKIRSLRRRATQRTPAQQRRAEIGAAYSQLPIGKLATELFTEIFVLALERDTGRTLKSLMEVCGIWEEIITSSPTVNAIIKYPMPRKDIQTAVKRANANPLTIIFHNERVHTLRRMEIFLEDAYRNSGRWKSLRMEVIFSEEVEGLANQPAPLLQECDLRSVNPGGPIDLFGGQAPLLKHLALHNVGIPWNSALLYNLRSLSLHQFRQHPCPTTQRILQILLNCPRLVSLSLDLDVHSQVPDGTSSNSLPVVILDELRTFHIIIHSDKVLSQFLPNIRIHPSVRLDVHSYGIAPAEVIGQLTPQLAYALSSGETRLHIISWLHEHTLQVCLSRTSSTLFQMTCNFDRSSEVLLALVNVNHRGTPTTFRVVEAGETWCNKIPIAPILDAVDRLPALDHLVLDHCSSEATTDILAHLSHRSTSEDGHTEWRCPLMDSLSLIRCYHFTPVTLLSMLSARADALCEKADGEGEGVSERPVALCSLFIDRAMDMDEQAFIKIETVIGEGKVHWCRRLDCQPPCEDY